MDKRDYMDSACCFDSSDWVKKPDAAPTPERLSVPDIIKGLDRLHAKGDEAAARLYLESWCLHANSIGDWRAEISILSELLGQYRRTGNEKEGLITVNRVTDLIERHNMGNTVSGATVLLNAATTLNCFGWTRRSLSLFEQVSRIYSENLDPMDYRFAGLYNNMALSYADMEDYPSAEHYFNRAIAVMKSCPRPENELAVTLCNKAEIYGKMGLGDEEIGDCLEQAWELLNSPELPRDSYHAFTASKCAPCFDYFGYFIYAMELRKRAEAIYEGT